MIIKPYGDLPRLYAPDIGEVIMARRSVSDKYIRAAVLDARRNRDGLLRIKVQWLEDNPYALRGDGRRDRPIVAGTTHALVIDPEAHPLFQYLNQGAHAT